MRRIELAVAVVLTMWAGDVLAQRQDGPPLRLGIGRPDSVMLLTNKSVQEELKFSKEQLEKAEKMQSIVTEAFKKARDAGREKFREIMESAQESRKKLAEELEQSLSPEQSKRFKQIQLQLKGPAALHSDEVLKTLKLTDEQKKALDDLLGKPFELKPEMRSFRPRDGERPNPLRRDRPDSEK